jgi:hypothetical protein
VQVTFDTLNCWMSPLGSCLFCEIGLNEYLLSTTVQPVVVGYEIEAHGRDMIYDVCDCHERA